jgi:hypothetical protein
MIDKKLKTIIPDTDFFFIFPVVNPITFRNEKKIIFFFSDQRLHFQLSNTRLCLIIISSHLKIFGGEKRHF